MIFGFFWKFKVRVLKYSFSINFEYNMLELFSRIKREYIKFEFLGIILYSIILVIKNVIL